MAAGTATIASPSAGNLLITTQTPRTVINWQSFSIGKTESVVVNQPNAGSILLDRVVAGGPISVLLGQMTSNGRLILINQAGIVVGSGAQITAAQLLFSTHDLSDANFLGGGTLAFNLTGDPNSKVVNHGTLTATGGSAILAGDAVKNDGVITAALGTVVLGAAKTYTVDFTGDGLLRFAVTAPVDQVAPGTKALVENSGTLSAPGGTVLLTGAAAKGVIDNVINTSGIIEATSVASVNGQIVLSGTGGGTLVSGTLDASGKGAGETGGSVAVTGDTVTLAAGARIDVSGDSGGGTAFIGGNFHGAGPLPNAQATTVSQGASIIADAITSGDGGQVAVWSDGVTRFSGAITARGGAKSGNGGYVETSGHQQLFVAGSVNTSAAHGHAGTWLLDPSDLTVCSATNCSTSGTTISNALLTGEVIIEAIGGGNNAQITG
ncbi:MAG TPA: filamentous hemagglutinin N-terminal domain-containing protein, partial [Polyangia bacterium]